MKSIIFALVIFLSVIAFTQASDASSEEDLNDVFADIQEQHNAMSQMEQHVDVASSSSSSSDDEDVSDERSIAYNPKMARFLALARAFAKSRGIQMRDNGRLFPIRAPGQPGGNRRRRAYPRVRRIRRRRRSFPSGMSLKALYSRSTGSRARYFQEKLRSGRYRRHPLSGGVRRYRRRRRYIRRRSIPNKGRKYRRRRRFGHYMRRYRRRRRTTKLDKRNKNCPVVMCTMALVQCKPNQVLKDRDANTGCRVCPHCVNVDKEDKDDGPTPKPHCPKLWCTSAPTRCDAGFVIHSSIMTNGCKGCPQCVKAEELKPKDHVIAKPIGHPVNPGGYVVAKPHDGSTSATTGDVYDEEEASRFLSRRRYIGRVRVNPKNYVWKNNAFVRKDIAAKWGDDGPSVPINRVMMLKRPNGFRRVRHGSFGARRCKFVEGKLVCQRRPIVCKFRGPKQPIVKPKVDAPTVTLPMPFGDPRVGKKTVCPMRRCMAPRCLPGQKMFTPTGKNNCPMCPTCVGKPTKEDRKEVMRPPVAQKPAPKVMETQAVRAVTTEVEEQGVAQKTE
eukprot:TRINITY_DN2300_c0_g1_i2.p1 TRINITY_DN2300_c0_g1~~TRINITY_DN2300_c0_g1_i2.p1  ORF type:complete len:557 (+),score=153.02 TRINITY_DN2300_c0_g1_i2:152-1822(+)